MCLGIGDGSQWEYICINMERPHIGIVSSALEILFPSNSTLSNQCKTGTQKILTHTKQTLTGEKKYLAPMYLYIEYLA